MNSPHMTARGKQLAALIAMVCALALPKRVECGYPGGRCETQASFGRTCSWSELEPFGFYLIEALVKSDVGFAYSTRAECR